MEIFGSVPQGSVFSPVGVMLRKHFLPVLFRSCINKPCILSRICLVSQTNLSFDSNSSIARNDSPIVPKKKRYNPLNLQSYTISERLEDLNSHRIWKLATSHPSVGVLNLEKELLATLNELETSNCEVDTAGVVSILDKLIQKYKSEYLTEQRLVNIIASFITQLDSSWIQERIILLLPASSEALGLLSPHVLAMSIAAFSKSKDLSEKTDKFVCALFHQLSDNLCRSLPILPFLFRPVIRTMANSSM